jgi:hypothetical protein
MHWLQWGIIAEARCVDHGEAGARFVRGDFDVGDSGKDNAEALSCRRGRGELVPKREWEMWVGDPLWFLRKDVIRGELRAR